MATNYLLYSPLTGTEYGIPKAANSSSDLITLDGKLGIGTTSPIFHLDIRKSNPTVCIGALTEYEDAALYFMTPYEQNTGSNQKAKCLLLAEGRGSYSRIDFHICLQSDPNNSIPATKSDSKLTIMGETGNVGIGTTSPHCPLHVKGSGGVMRNGIYNYFHTDWPHGDGLVRYQVTNGGIAFGTSDIGIYA